MENFLYWIAIHVLFGLPIILGALACMPKTPTPEPNEFQDLIDHYEHEHQEWMLRKGVK